MRRRLLLISLFAAFPAWAEEAVPVVEVRGARILLSDYAPSAPSELRNIDLGQAPEPGKSRYLGQGEVRKVLRQLGVAASLLQLRERVRLVTRCHQMAPDEFSPG